MEISAMNVLIVEDDPATAHFFLQVITSREYSTPHIAHSAEEALSMAIRTTYDLITLDVQLPGISGLEILSVIRNLHPHAIIAIISGHVSENISQDIVNCADVIIKKPVAIEKLEKLLKSTDNICKEMANIRAL